MMVFRSTARLVTRRASAIALLAAVLVCVLSTGNIGAAVAAAQQNVFPEGAFENVKIDPGGQTGWWGVTGDKVKILEKGGEHWLRLENGIPGQSAQSGRRFPLSPEWDAVIVKARLRVDNLKVGKNAWETAKIDFEVLDGNKQPIPGASATISAVAADTAWKESSVRIELPGNAAYLHIITSIWVATGVFEVDDLQISPQKAEFNEKEEDATLPADQKLTWGQEPVEVLSSKREQIVLNGIWQFVPLLDTAETRPPGGMAYIRVPGSWSPGAAVPGLVSERGQGPAWKRWGTGTGKWAAWYQRKIKIPSGWDGRAIVIELERVSTDAIVYANGVKCGGVSWPYGEVDISKAVKAGEEVTLSILVLSTTEGTTEMFLDPGRVITRAAALSSRGLIGDVLLSSRPRGAHISDVFVQTSTRRKQLTLEVEVSDVTAAAAGPVRFVAKLMDGSGKEEKRFQAQANLTGNKQQTVQLSWTWEKPRLWDFKQPNLYTLRLEAKGANLADEYVQPFGFREFWIEGKKFFLNGSEIRLRPVSHTYTEHSMSGYTPLVDAHIDGTIHAGFNIEEMWPVDHDERGRPHFRELWAERADRKGFLLMGTALNMNRGKWAEPGYKEQWTSRLDEELRRYRNHPSIVMWTTNPNWLGHGLDQDPRYIGREKEIPAAADPWRVQSVEIALAGNAVIKKLDPTRPVVNHAGASVGDVYNINSYLNFIPLQEREQWLSEWGKSGKMPVMMVEFGTPWKDTFFRNRYGHAANSEPWVTEFGAIYLGPQAYALETPAYRQVIAKRFEGGQIYGAWPQEMLIDYAPAYQKIQALFNRNTYRSWRTWGISGGMVPWDYGYGWDMFWNERRRKGVPDEIQQMGPFKPGTRGLYTPTALKLLTKPFQPEGMDLYPAGVALMEANGPTLAWIAGGSKAGFTAKDHNFAAGQAVDKQVVLLNDERTPRSFSYAWSAKVDGKEVAKSSGKGSLIPAQTLFIPLRFKAPAAPGKAKADGVITLTAKIGAREHKDSFAFGVFAKPAPVKQAVTLYDPVGKTTKTLAALGITTRPWNTTSTPAGGLVIIGREAMSGGKPLPFDLEAMLRGGGRVLICAQNPAWLRNQLGLRIATFPARRVFPVAKAHPALQGLDAEDLSDWAGDSTLTEPYPTVPLQTPLWRSPTHGWHWGNRGAVTSAAIEKPHRSGWRPLLECEFDLAYTPLMELDYGKGRLILSTLDLEDHVPQDAAAALLARNLVDYAATAARPLARSQRTILVGDDNDKKALDGLGVLYQTSARIEPDADLVIVGRQVKYDEPQVQSYLEKGGRMLFLSRDAPDHGLGVKLEQAPAFAGSLQVPAWPEAQGLSASDLRWRSEAPAWLVKAGVEVGADGLLGRLSKGKGVALFSQIDPDRFQADTKTYFRFTRWRQTRALSQLLANLGATFVGDKGAASLTKTEAGYYHPDYRTDFELGDDPYRYFRW